MKRKFSLLMVPGGQSCARAQWEIRNLANKMLEICKEYLPAVFSEAGPKCVVLGYCPEGEKFTCGAYPLKEKIV